jgi:ssDNA-binding Zn-finger/Zn-ribbon topoisomerase 1
MGKITWNTDVIAPCCPGEIVNDDGRTLLIQTDWDYPSVASNFGWSLREVQNPAKQVCPKCRLEENPEDMPDDICPDCHVKMNTVPRGECRHSGTDGTVDCKECGVTADEFIEAAGEWLRNNDGATADDPG